MYVGVGIMHMENPTNGSCVRLTDFTNNSGVKKSYSLLKDYHTEAKKDFKLVLVLGLWRLDSLHGSMLLARQCSV